VSLLGFGEGGVRGLRAAALPAPPPASAPLACELCGGGTFILRYIKPYLQYALQGPFRV
jgi:hypothetical protein